MNRTIFHKCFVRCKPGVMKVNRIMTNSSTLTQLEKFYSLNLDRRSALANDCVSAEVLTGSGWKRLIEAASFRYDPNIPR